LALGANFEHFGLVVTNTIGPKGCCKLASLIRWYPFSSLGANTRPSSSAFIRNFGQIEKIFSHSALTPSVKQAKREREITELVFFFFSFLKHNNRPYKTTPLGSKILH
jgi:hypothetical protein